MHNILMLLGFFSVFKMPLPSILNKYIVRSEIKLNKSNFKIFCKPCIEELEEDEGKKIFFPNKKDRIIVHLKKCSHFVATTTAEERTEIFELLEDNNSLTSTIPSKRLGKY